MKTMQKILIWAIITVFILFPVAAPIMNDVSAADIEKHLAKIPLPENTEYVESVSMAGKLVGNGNGMQFLGAMLVRSELNLEELEEYYSAYRENEWECLVEKQEGQKVRAVEHGSLSFKTDVSAGGYYIVYSWGDGIEPFVWFDIRGN